MYSSLMNSGNISAVFAVIEGNLKREVLTWYDYTFFTLLLSLSGIIGVYFGCFGTKQATTDEYLMGDRKMGVIPTSISLIAGHTSGFSLLAEPAEVYRYGATYWVFVPAFMIVVLITNYVYLPVFHKLDKISLYEYLEKRYDARNRKLASFLFTLSYFFYLPIVIYLPSLALASATGFKILYIALVVCSVCIFYTTIGGLKAVIWTDTLQFIVTTGAVITVFVLGLKSVGGFGVVWKHALDSDRLDIFDFDPDPTKRDSFWICLIGLVHLMFAITGINQTCVQKYLSVPTLEKSKRTVVYFGLGQVLVNCFCVFTGLLIYTKYAKCDPLTTGQVTKSDQLFPYYVMDIASDVPGLRGLFFAGIFSASLSTLSASLNCLSGTIYEDYLRDYVVPQSEKAVSNYLKRIVIVVGVICTLFVFVIERLDGILRISFSFSSVTNGPLLGMFTLGILVPKSSSKGTFYGTIIGLVFTAWVVFTAQYYIDQGMITYPLKATSIDGCLFGNSSAANVSTSLSKIQLNRDSFSKPFLLFRISYYYYCPLGALVTFVSGLFLSCVVENKDPSIDKDLLSPVIHRFLKDNSRIQIKYTQLT